MKYNTITLFLISTTLYDLHENVTSETEFWGATSELSFYIQLMHHRKTSKEQSCSMIPLI